MHFTIFRIFTFLLVINSIDSIIRNDITNRCLHIGLIGRKDRDRLYTTTCTWNSLEGTRSHPDEWLEIVSSDEYAKDYTTEDRRIYYIRKIANASNVCLATINDEPDVSNRCSTPDASFALDIVYQKNFKGLLTSYSSFKIRNNLGKCLTVWPGHSDLQFKDCSPRQGLFQVWSVCSHNRVCDVDLTWTPRHIVFPKNDTDISDNVDKPTANTSSTDFKKINAKETEVKAAASRSTNVNEVLYTVQNAAKIYESSEQFLVNGIAAFYTSESLAEAHLLLVKICAQDNLTCSLCKQCGSDQKSPNNTVAWLMKWNEECNNDPSSSRAFLSRDAFQVPHHLLPSHDSSHLKVMPLTEKYKLIIPNLRKYLNEMEGKLREHEPNVTGTNPLETADALNFGIDSEKENRPDVNGEDEKPNTTKVADNTHGENKSQHGTAINTSSQLSTEMNNTTQDYESLIDIRFFNG